MRRTHILGIVLAVIVTPHIQSKLSAQTPAEAGATYQIGLGLAQSTSCPDCSSAERAMGPAVEAAVRFSFRGISLGAMVEGWRSSSDGLAEIRGSIGPAIWLSSSRFPIYLRLGIGLGFFHSRQGGVIGHTGYGPSFQSDLGLTIYRGNSVEVSTTVRLIHDLIGNLSTDIDGAVPLDAVVDEQFDLVASHANTLDDWHQTQIGVGVVLRLK